MSCVVKWLMIARFDLPCCIRFSTTRSSLAVSGAGGARPARSAMTSRFQPVLGKVWKNVCSAWTIVLECTQNPAFGPGNPVPFTTLCRGGGVGAFQTQTCGEGITIARPSRQRSLQDHAV